MWTWTPTWSRSTRRPCGTWSCREEKATMKTTAPTASEVLRQAIRESGQSLYRIAKGANVGYASLYRFANGERSVSLDVFDRLLTYFGLELRPRGKEQLARPPGCRQ